MTHTNPTANTILQRWDRLRRLPFGRLLFSRLIGLAAPYTGSIGATVLSLAPGCAELRIEDRRRLRNHLRSLHAVALINLAELTGNLAMMTRQPTQGAYRGARWIVTGLDADFRKKARGRIIARCEIAPLDWSADCAVEGRVELRDAGGDLVMLARPRWQIGPSRAAATAAAAAAAR